MRKFPLISLTFLGLGLSFGLAACDGDDGNDVKSEETAGDGDPGDGDGEPGDGDGEPGDGDGDGEGSCFDAPEQCLRFVTCIGAVAPDQQAVVEATYGEDGSCWCGTDAEAQECFKTCVDQLATAIKTKPTEQACHEKSCSLDQLDPTLPYGPPQGGACPDWDLGTGTVYQQIPVSNFAGTTGSFCSPPCTGIANTCPGHSQTAAAGTCALAIGGEDHCALRCWVDPEAIGGTQCHCGATCRQAGGPDGEGNLRGFCTFD